MIHLKKYNTKKDYNDGVELAIPYVAIIKDDDEVIYSSDSSEKYEDQYFTIHSLKDGTYIDVFQGESKLSSANLQYSVDNGETWEDYELTGTKRTYGKKIFIDKGQRVLFKGENENGIASSANSPAISFAGEGEYAAYGNIRSLFYGDNFKENGDKLPNYACANLFRRSQYINDSNRTGLVYAHNLIIGNVIGAYSCFDMFQGCTKLVTAPELPATTLADCCYRGMFNDCTSLINAPELPATTLADRCYNGMFRGCTSLANAPALPATILVYCCYDFMFYDCTSLINAPELTSTTLADSCYDGMFSGCTSLVNAPALPATTLADRCYNGMFSGCTSLVNAPALPATTLADSCYSKMFEGCTKLVTAPELPATTLADYCYNYMFDGCTNIVNAPELPATILVNNCYSYMFNDCTSLVNAPELPVTTLANDCYKSMFEGCTSLVTAPELPATTLESGCYYRMFSGCTSLVNAPKLPATTLKGTCYWFMFDGCTSLKYIKAMFTTEPSNTNTYYWLRNVSSTGTFVKNAAATWDIRGEHGIPRGWTVKTATA